MVMSKGKILVVDPDEQIRWMMKTYFTGQGYEVVCVADGKTALQSIADEFLPRIIVMENKLPDMTGYEVCKILRTTADIPHIPIIFLMPHKRPDRITSLELGADAYVSKPLDLEVLKLYVVNAIHATNRPTYVDAITNLPKGKLIDEYLKKLMEEKSSKWAYIDIKIQNFEPFSEVYGWEAGDEFVRSTSLLIADMVGKSGREDDFVGHPGRDMFVVITYSEGYKNLLEKLVEQFNTMIVQRYSSEDAERGYIMDEGKQVPLMSLTWGVCDTRETAPEDVRHVTEIASANRHKKDPNYGNEDDVDDILTAW
jgi:CheY-like chemotaxis protein